MGKFQEDMDRHTRGEIEHPKSPLDDSDYNQANADLPMFLDSMLYYLRIQADSFAEGTLRQAGPPIRRRIR